MKIDNKELNQEPYLTMYRVRYAKYGPHPTCQGCPHTGYCMVPAMPGYEFTCGMKGGAKRKSDVKGQAGGGPAKAEGGPPPKPKTNKRHGGW